MRDGHAARQARQRVRIALFADTDDPIDLAGLLNGYEPRATPKASVRRTGDHVALVYPWPMAIIDDGRAPRLQADRCFDAADWDDHLDSEVALEALSTALRDLEGVLGGQSELAARISGHVVAATKGIPRERPVRYPLPRRPPAPVGRRRRPLGNHDQLRLSVAIYGVEDPDGAAELLRDHFDGQTARHLPRFPQVIAGPDQSVRMTLRGDPISHQGHPVSEFAASEFADLAERLNVERGLVGVERISFHCEWLQPPTEEEQFLLRMTHRLADA